MNFFSGRGEGTSEAGKDPELVACVFTFMNSFIPLFNKEFGEFFMCQASP